MIAPDRKLVITPTTIAAASFSDLRERRAAIDVFFRSLAEKHGDGFAVVLSGGGSDGALGARAVKEAGGVVLVQDPREATHEAMPRSVIAAEVGRRRAAGARPRSAARRARAPPAICSRR